MAAGTKARLAVIIASPNSIMPMARPIPKWTSTAIARQSRRVSRGQTRAA